MDKPPGIWKFAFVLSLIIGEDSIVLAQPVPFNRVILPISKEILITCMTQDKQGYMWFGTQNGLYRYDGYNITPFRHEASSANSLSTERRNSSGSETSGSLGSDYVECIFTDSNNLIWIGTFGAGLDLLNPETGVFVHFRHKLKDPGSLINDSVTAVLGDRQGTIWVGTHKGLDQLDRKTGKFKHFQYNSMDPSTLSHNHVRAIYEDLQGTLWIGTGSAFFNDVTLPGEGGLNRLDKKTGKFIRYMHDPKDPNSLVDNRVRALFEDSHGVFWVGTCGDGLHTMNREKGTFERHLYDSTHPEKLSRPPIQRKYSYCDDQVGFICEDAVGKIWIGTIEGGISVYDPKSMRITPFAFQKDTAGALNETGGWCAYTSRDGILWVSAFLGNLYRINPSPTRRIPFYLTGAGVYRFLEESDKILWLLTPNGLIRQDRIRGTAQHFFTDSLDPRNKGSHPITDFGRDKDGRVWIGSYGSGIARFDPNKEAFTYYRHDLKNSSSLNNDNVVAIYEDRSGNLWIGTDGGGLDLFDPNKEAFIHYSHDSRNSSSLSNDNIVGIYEDRLENLWIVTPSGLDKMNRNLNGFMHFQHDSEDSNSALLGNYPYLVSFQVTSTNDLWVGSESAVENTITDAHLNRMNLKTKKIKHYPQLGNYIYAIYEDSDSVLWVGTNTGLYRFNERLDKLTKFIDPGGLEIENTIRLIEDDQKNLWVSMTNGILKLNPGRTECGLYSENYGINPDRFYSPCMYKGRKGEIFVGSDSGYYAFFPKEITTQAKGPEVSISEIWLGDKLIKRSERGPLEQPLSQAQRIKFPYNKNVLTIGFNAIDYVNPQENRIIYMLENYDHNWKKAGAERKAYYFNLAPGQYTFKVKAINSDQVWAERDLEIILSPPWWNTWWFRVGAALFIIAILYYLLRWNLKANFRKKFERLEKDRQLAELQNKTSELEMQVLRSQMNPHFIFNSLNSINRFIMQNEQEQASEYLTKFSRLVRLIFQNSQEALIGVEEELETLKLYLELEKLRFENRFEYAIFVDPDLDISILKLPPLIIQPYVENAIWHGLMNKEENGKLTIALSQKNEHLLIKITDDGVGRKQASILGSKSATRHKSMGLHLTAARIDLLNHSDMKESIVRINDLVHPDGTPAGTEVIIKIPITYD